MGVGNKQNSNVYEPVSYGLKRSVFVKYRPAFLVVSGPSGTGKSTLIHHLLGKYGGKIHFSISATTRKPRIGEKDGVDYFFLSHDEFKKKIEEDEFLEWQEVHGNYYGTLKSEVIPYLEAGIDVVLDIDVKGGFVIKKKIPQAALVFVAPPSIDELKKRLFKRSTDTPEIIEKRLKVASWECEQGRNYDYVVVNDDLDEACKLIEAIYLAEKLKLR